MGGPLYQDGTQYQYWMGVQRDLNTEAKRGRQRKIDSLQRLAERPGTPAEGAVARAMLEKLKSKID